MLSYINNLRLSEKCIHICMPWIPPHILSNCKILLRTWTEIISPCPISHPLDIHFSKLGSVDWSECVIGIRVVVFALRALLENSVIFFYKNCCTEIEITILYIWILFYCLTKLQNSCQLLIWCYCTHFSRSLKVQKTFY